MAKKLSKALRTDLNQMAALLRSKGRNGDTILAHINPEEAALLKARGGSGKPNPETGLPEFQEYADFGADTGPSWWDKFTDTFSFGGGRDTSGQDLSQYNIEVPETPSSQEFTLPSDASIGDWNRYQEALTGVWPQMLTPESASGGYTDKTGATYDAQGQYLGQAPGFETSGKPTLLSSITGAVRPDLSGTLYGTGGGAEDKITTDKSALEKIEELAKKYPKSAGALESLLGIGAKVGLGYLGAKPMQRTQTRAAQEAQQMGEQFAALGKPIQAMGYQQLAQAEAGQLTPVQQRQLAATQAQQRQALSRAGISSGTAALQTQANLQRMANEFTQNNINTALNMIQFGDKYIQQGIKAGYDANQAANQTANIFYQNLFGLLGGTGNVLRG